MYTNKKIFILGMARSGYEVAKLLSSDNEVIITDMKEQDKDKISELENLGVKFIMSKKDFLILSLIIIIFLLLLLLFIVLR